MCERGVPDLCFRTRQPGHQENRRHDSLQQLLFGVSNKVLTFIICREEVIWPMIWTQEVRWDHEDWLINKRDCSRKEAYYDSAFRPS